MGKDTTVHTEESEDGAEDCHPRDGTPPLKPRKENLIVRLDQPVEGVGFEAYTLLRGVDGGVVTPSSRRLTYQWMRSKAKHSCASPTCPDRLKPALITALAGTNKRYCSTHCFQEDWKKTDVQVRTQRYYKDLVTEAEQTQLLKMDHDGELFVFPMPQYKVINAWDVISEQRLYTPSKQDTGHILKIRCSAMSPDGRVTVSSESRPTAPVMPAPPPPLSRRTIKNQNVTHMQDSGFDFRVVTYNILADLYATPQMYPYCPSWALKWSYRRAQLLKELVAYDGDIICLQEVQGVAFENYLLPELRKLGYEGLFKQKTRPEAVDRNGKVLNTVDGCAMFYRTSRFVLREKVDIEFNSVARQMANNGMFNTTNHLHTNRILKRLLRDNVGQIVFFDVISTLDENATHPVAVANTHIFWDPEYPEVKLWQTHVLLRELESKTGQNQLPLVLCGDFNSMPDSSVFELLAKEHVSPNHKDLKDPSGILPHASSLTHSLNLCSVYTMCNKSEPEFTNYTSSYNGVLDYIFVTQQNVTAKSVLEIPSTKELQIPLPNPHIPSDHVALVADVRIGFNTFAHSPSATGSSNMRMNGSMHSRNLGYHQ